MGTVLRSLIPNYLLSCPSYPPILQKTTHFQPTVGWILFFLLLEEGKLPLQINIAFLHKTALRTRTNVFCRKSQYFIGEPMHNPRVPQPFPWSDPLLSILAPVHNQVGQFDAQLDKTMKTISGNAFLQRPVLCNIASSETTQIGVA